MPTDRLVHEVLFSRKENRAFGAFIQHGTREDGFIYEFVCPFCALTIDKLAEEKDDLGPIELFASDIAKHTRKVMQTHLFLCTASMKFLRVRKTTQTLLNTEKVIKEQ